MSNPQPVQSSSAWLPANPANPFNSQKPINGLTNSSSSVSGRTTTPTTTPHNGGNSQQTTLAQQRQQLRQLLQSHHATQSNTNQVAGAATGYPRAHVTDIGDTNASTRFATSISPGSAQPGYGSGPVLATDIDDASYIEEQLFNHPNYLADLARLGVYVPANLLPPAYQHLATAPPVNIASSQSSDPASGNLHPSSSMSSSSSSLAIATSVPLQQPLRVNPEDVRAVHPPNSSINSTSVYNGSDPRLAEDNAFSYTRAAHIPRPADPATSNTTTKPSETVTYVESKTTGDFKRVTGQWDANGSVAGPSTETPEQRQARLQQLQYAHYAGVYVEGTNSLQLALSFFLLLACGGWCGISFLQVYWAQTRSSDGAFITAFATVAPAVYVAHFLLGGVTVVLTCWFFVLEHFTTLKRFRMREWEWQSQLNFLCALAAFIGFVVCLASISFDSVLIQFETRLPSWYLDPTLLSLFQSRMDRYFQLTVVRFIVVVVLWVCLAFKYAFNHAINPNLPHQAQYRTVRSVPLPPSVPLHPTSASLHAEENPRAYVNVHRHLLIEQEQQSRTGLVLWTWPWEQDTTLLNGVDRSAVLNPGGHDNVQGQRSVFAFV